MNVTGRMLEKSFTFVKFSFISFPILSIEIRSSGESLTLLPRKLREIKVTYCWIGSQECATYVVQLKIKPTNAKIKLQST
jgi:hypothetical protein